MLRVSSAPGDRRHPRLPGAAARRRRRAPARQTPIGGLRQSSRIELLYSHARSRAPALLLDQVLPHLGVEVDGFGFRVSGFGVGVKAPAGQRCSIRCWKTFLGLRLIQKPTEIDLASRGVWGKYRICTATHGIRTLFLLEHFLHLLYWDLTKRLQPLEGPTTNKSGLVINLLELPLCTEVLL